MAEKFLRSYGKDLVQAFPLIKDHVNIVAAGGAKSTTLFCCAVDGTFAVTFSEGGDPVNIVMVAGDVFSIPNGGTVLATGSASFHYV